MTKERIVPVGDGSWVIIPGWAECRQLGRHDLPPVVASWPAGTQTTCQTCGVAFVLRPKRVGRRENTQALDWQEEDRSW